FIIFVLSLHDRSGETSPIVRNYSNSRSQIYEMIGDVRIHGNSSAIWVANDRDEKKVSWNVKPYARLADRNAMSGVTETKIIMNRVESLPNCTKYFHVPGMIFSVGGYAGHANHGISDVIIPLYFTSHEFNGSVMFFLLDSQPWWVSRYKLIFNALSNYETVTSGNDNEVLCFSRVIIGLDADGDECRAGPGHFSDHSMTDFARFIRNTYSLERHKVDDEKSPHRALIISRRSSRFISNQDEIAETCRRMGFEVEINEIDEEFDFIARYVNTFDVMIGLHGAGIVNMIFLPENAIVIQIIPYGLRDIARFYYQQSATDMNFRYLEHLITWEESSLSNTYPKYSQVYFNSAGNDVLGWEKFRSIYLDINVTIDMNRFEKILVKAKHLL
ncbi:hypothetical protein M569_04186, partial [Genlisea aurea]